MVPLRGDARLLSIFCERTYFPSVLAVAVVALVTDEELVYFMQISRDLTPCGTAVQSVYARLCRSYLFILTFLIRNKKFNRYITFDNNFFRS